MAKRLIDADALYKAVKEAGKDAGFYSAIYEGFLDCINRSPTVDAVEVCYCKDCKWWGKPGCAIYIVDDTDKPGENDFCSCGERRADE